MERVKKSFAKALMFEKGIPQKEVAKRTGIPAPIISMYLNGRYILDQQQIKKLADVLNCPIDKLSSQVN